MRNPEDQSKGSLTVVSTGIKYHSHMTLEALEAIQRTEKLYYAMADIMTERWLEELNPSAEPLPDYFPDRPRKETYDHWVKIILDSVRQGLRTCAASYGHAGVFTFFSRTAMRAAWREGYEAVMLPGISTEASLLCDLLVDPAEGGWQSYGAAYFLKRKPVFDIRSQLILWMITTVDCSGPPNQVHRKGLRRLSEHLMEHYGTEHEVVVYEASRNPALAPIITSVPLRRLPEVKCGCAATLYVPRLETDST